MCCGCALVLLFSLATMQCRHHLQEGLGLGKVGNRPPVPATQLLRLSGTSLGRHCPRAKMPDPFWPI